VGRSQEYYESFFIDDLDNIDEFKKFHLLLCKENLIRKEGQSPTFSLSEKTKEHIQDISVSFYNLYKNIRIQLYEEMKASNPEIDNAILVEKAQKFLDRIIFICFCEDLGLLPNNLLHHAIQRGKDSFSDNEYVIWQEIRGVFTAIDGGSAKHDIPAYNGGLFAFDEMLDNLSIKNNFFETIYEISAYDFGTDLDVNILGHIFEQSISDIEELKADVQNEDYDPQKSRRKKDGIFYTPSYITKYIVENSLGKYLEDIRKSLGEEELPDIEAATTAQLEGRYKKKLLQFYRDYEVKLQKVKVLDPACGSGAFLNQAFDFLLDEYRWTHNKIAELGEGQISIFDSDSYQRSVLHNNLYGVDLNEESVEISKLSLWLKTADSRNALPYLDNNIKCGNSLIDDPEVAGDKAFRWEEEFSEIMTGGGFDVVIGNPPYVRPHKIALKIKAYLWEEYSLYKEKTDLFVCFMDLITRKLLRNEGYFSFIVPHSWTSLKSFKNLREYVSKYTRLIKLVQLDKKVFADATVQTCIFVIKRSNLTDIRDNYVTIERLYNTSIIKAIRQFPQSDILNNFLFNMELYMTSNKGILIKIDENGYKLKNFVAFAYGLKTGDDNKFITNEKHNGNCKPLVRSGDIGRYLIDYKGELVNYDIEGMKQNSKYARPGTSERFEQPKIVVSRMSDRIIASYDPGILYVKDGMLLHSIGKDVNLLYILGVLNSRTTKFYYTNYFRTIDVLKNALMDTPIPNATNSEQNAICDKVKIILALNQEVGHLSNKLFIDFVNKYASMTVNELGKVINRSNYVNRVYEGRMSKLGRLTVILNDKMVNVYKDKDELLKFEVKDHYQRQYLKLYLENLTEEQLAEINQYSGNILDKVMQITIPDYDKPEVVRKVVNEWNQLQAEIADLEKKIEETDKEIDQMVYELYGLTEDEIKIVEEETN
jgi:type I restriction-modification system DNA methylase subunit